MGAHAISRADLEGRPGADADSDRSLYRSGVAFEAISKGNLCSRDDATPGGPRVEAASVSAAGDPVTGKKAGAEETAVVRYENGTEAWPQLTAVSDFTSLPHVEADSTSRAPERPGDARGS